MNIRNLFAKGIKKGPEIDPSEDRDRRNVDIVLSVAFQKAILNKEIYFPSAYIDFLRDCTEKKELGIRQIKTDSGKNEGTSARRFSALVDVLRKNVPPIKFSIAEEIALIADSLRRNFEPVESCHWAGDVSACFELSSSFGTKGRILAAIVRYTQSKRCLELGTGYGVSSLFILEALKARGAQGHLTTIEGAESTFSVTSKILETRYGDQVSCHFGWVQKVLPKIVKSLEGLDFLFHDAGHSREDYVRDFHTVLPAMAPGAMVLIDDIRWEDPRFFTGNPHCYKGWMKVVHHPRVRQAVEISGVMGLLLLHG
jgi:predicted O-methyltransferase YrrM